MKQIHVWITSAELRQLKDFAAMDGESLATIVRQALRSYVGKRHADRSLSSEHDRYGAQHFSTTKVPIAP